MILLGRPSSTSNEASSVSSASHLQNLTKKDLLKIIRRKANLLWESCEHQQYRTHNLNLILTFIKVIDKKSKGVPWVALQDAENTKYTVKGWPQNVGGGMKNGRFDFDGYNKEDLLILFDAFSKNKITFERNQ